MTKLMLDNRRRANSVSPRRGGGDDGGLRWCKRSESFRILPTSYLNRESHNSDELTPPRMREVKAEGKRKEKEKEKAKAKAGHRFTNKEYLNILQCMGQSVHIFDSDGIIIYWDRSAEKLYGYSAAEAIGTDLCDLLVSRRDVPFAEVVIQRCSLGQSWTGQFPVKDKFGQRFPVIATNTPLYDDDGTHIGIVCVSSDSRPFKDVPVFMSDSKEAEKDQDFSRSTVTSRLGLDPDQSLQTAITSKITNLASKVSDKVRSRMKTTDSNVLQECGIGENQHSEHGPSNVVVSDHREDVNSNEASTPRGDPAGTPFGTFLPFSINNPPSHAQGDSINEGEGKQDIRKSLTSKAEVWIGKKAMQWSRKGNERESSDSQSGRFGWPWMQHEQVSNRPCSTEKSEIQTGGDNRPITNDVSGSWSSFNSTASSGGSGSGSGSGSTIRTLDAETDSLDYEISWKDLTVGEQIGQGSCGTVYHGLWCGLICSLQRLLRCTYCIVVFSWNFL